MSAVRACRRSGLGPLWNTVGVLMAVATVGMLFGTFLRRQLGNVEDYVNALAAALVMWSFLSAVTNDSAIAFARWMPVIRHSPLSFSVIALSVLLRHLPVLLINVALLVMVQAVLLGRWPAFPLLAAAMILLVANVGWMGICALVLGARFRDIGQLVANALQIAFLLTPILWPPYFLGRFEYLLLLNPFYSLLSVFSGAAMNLPIPADHWLAALVMTGLGGGAALTLYRWSRRRWRYWI